MTTKFKLLTFAALLATSSAFAQLQTGRIVTIDLNRVFNEYYKTPIASAKLKETAEQYNKDHEELMTNYKKNLDELNKLREDQDKTEYTAEVREAKKKAVQDKLAETQKAQREIEEFRATHKQSLDQQTLRMRTGIVKEIKDIIQKEARDAGYGIILDRSGNTANGEPTVIYSQEGLDITDDIIKVLNKNKPADLPKVEEKK